MYESTRLSPERHEVRILTILPSRYLADQVSCTMNRVSLDDDPSYEALSYTWSDSGAFSGHLPTASSVEPGEITFEVTPFQVTSNFMRRYGSSAKTLMRETYG